MASLADAELGSSRRAGWHRVVKVVLFYLAFLPQFLTPQGWPISAQILVLRGLLIAIGLVMDSMIGVNVRRCLSRADPTPGVRRPDAPFKRDRLVLYFAWQSRLSRHRAADPGSSPAPRRGSPGPATCRAVDGSGLSGGTIEDPPEPGGPVRSAPVGSQVGPSARQNCRVTPEADLVIARNRKAAHDYQLGESWEAGIVLQGLEVKALRAGRASLVGGFAAVEDREIWLYGVHIPQYSQARWSNDGSRRKRKLLLHRAQIDKIERKVNESGLTLVPVSLYFKDGRAKVEIALARGKKIWDKRQTLAEREARREAERAVSRRLKGRPD